MLGFPREKHGCVYSGGVSLQVYIRLYSPLLFLSPLAYSPSWLDWHDDKGEEYGSQSVLFIYRTALGPFRSLASVLNGNDRIVAYECLSPEG